MACGVCQGLPPVPPTDPSSTTKLVCFGEAGGAEEARQRRGFVGESGRLLRKALLAGGFSVWNGWPGKTIPPEYEQVAFRNIIPATPPGNVFPGYGPARSCLLTCQGEFYRTDDHPWLACGTNAVEALSGYRLPILDIRGSLLPVKDRDKWFVATMHPAFLVRGGKDNNPNQEQGKSQDELYPLLALDAQRAVKWTKPQIPQVTLVQPGELLAQWQTQKPKLVAVDIEGGTPPTLVGMCWEPGYAYVMQWGTGVAEALNIIFSSSTPIFHNANYDIPELLGSGIKPIREWVDTINTAALINPSVKLGLESQTLSYVSGTIAWKGLIDHVKGYDYSGGDVGFWREVWTEILGRLSSPRPKNGFEWFVFYNGLDVESTYRLALAHRQELEGQGRMNAYRDVLMPLQRPVLEMGLRGLPVDLGRMEYHASACRRLERMAQTILDLASKQLRDQVARGLQQDVEEMRNERDVERAAGQRKYSRSDELGKLQTKLRTAKEAAEGKFNMDSYLQRKALLCDWLGLPPIVDRKTKGASTNEKAVEALLSRVQRGTVKPKNATVAEALRVLRAMTAGHRWALWRRNFLTLKGQ